MRQQTPLGDAFRKLFCETFGHEELTYLDPAGVVVFRKCARCGRDL